MEQEMVTRRVKVFKDKREGDLVYQYGGTSVERTEDHIIIKVMAPRHENWLQLADFMDCAVIGINNWGYDKMKEEDIWDFAQLPVQKRDAEFERFRDEDAKFAEDPEIGSAFDYKYFYDIQNWVMYENELQYLFVYEMEFKDVYNNGIESQVDALAFWAHEDLKTMLEFLRAWYYRVNGVEEGE